jgi:hypothetical protein
MGTYVLLLDRAENVPRHETAVREETLHKGLVFLFMKP